MMGEREIQIQVKKAESHQSMRGMTLDFTCKIL